MFPGLKQTIVAAALLGFGGVAGWHGSRVLGDSATDELPRFAQPFARAVRRTAALVGPSVVRIEAKHASGLSPSAGFGAPPLPEAFPDEMARRLFMSPFGFEGEGDQARFVTRGSGIIIDASGLVLANAHVIASRAATRRIELPEVRVELADGRALPAIVLGCDAGSDLALLRLPEGTSGLTAARLGDSERLEPGDWVVALGRTFGPLTLSAGIVSTKGKAGLAPRFEDFIETDAAVNPANSGGPLVSLEGEVIGVNVGPAWTTSGGSLGLGFAVPSNTAGSLRREIDEISAVSRDLLGALVRPLLPSELEGRRGLLVASIGAGAAASAGIHEGDALLAIDGKPVEDGKNLRAFAGKKVAASIWCGGRVSEVELELAAGR